MPSMEDDDEPRIAMGPSQFSPDLRGFVSRLVEVLKAWGREKEVAILLAAQSISFSVDEQDSNYDVTQFYMHITLSLAAHTRMFGPHGRFNEIKERLRFTDAGRTLGKYMAPDAWLRATTVGFDVEANPHWESDALNWLKGVGVSNQGRVRSNNVASREADGLLFRSEAEIHLYRALKAQGALFAPLPVFLQGGSHYKRVEPDFVLLAEGAVMIVEVDGDNFHVETPAAAQERVRMFEREGVLIERIPASECSTTETAAKRARQLLEQFAARRRARR